jgi:hypothetical protein
MVVEKEFVLTMSNEYKTQVDISRGIAENTDMWGALVAERKLKHDPSRIVYNKREAVDGREEDFRCKRCTQQKSMEATQLIARKKRTSKANAAVRDTSANRRRNAINGSPITTKSSPMWRTAMTLYTTKAKDIAMRYQQRDRGYVPRDS